MEYIIPVLLVILLLYGGVVSLFYPRRVQEHFLKAKQSLDKSYIKTDQYLIFVRISGGVYLLISFLLAVALIIGERVE